LTHLYSQGHYARNVNNYSQYELLYGRLVI